MSCIMCRLNHLSHKCDKFLELHISKCKEILDMQHLFQLPLPWLSYQGLSLFVGFVRKNVINSQDNTDIKTDINAHCSLKL